MFCSCPDAAWTVPGEIFSELTPAATCFLSSYRATNQSPETTYAEMPVLVSGIADFFRQIV
jgi:hypothetical protein